MRDYHSILEREDETSAYLLGFWYADGCIFKSWSNGRKNFQGSVHFSGKDFEHMTMIARFFGKEPRPIKGCNCFQVKVKSDKIFHHCYNLIGSTSKSNKAISVPRVQPHNFHHFVRGFFDGDGSIYVKRYNNRHGKQTSELGTSFTSGVGSAQFLEELKKAIRNHIPVGDKKIAVGSNSKLIFGQYDSMLLCDWMYSNAIFYMRRKKNIWDSADKNRLLKSQKYFSNKV